MKKTNRQELLWGFDYLSKDIFKQKSWEIIITKKLFEAEKRAPSSKHILELINSTDKKGKEELFNSIIGLLKSKNEYYFS